MRKRRIFFFLSCFLQDLSCLLQQYICFLQLRDQSCFFCFFLPSLPIQAEDRKYMYTPPYGECAFLVLPEFILASVRGLFCLMDPEGLDPDLCADIFCFFDKKDLTLNTYVCIIII